MNDLILIHVRYQALNLKQEEVTIISAGDFLLDYIIRRRIQIRMGVYCTFYFINRYGAQAVSGRQYHSEWSGPKPVHETIIPPTDESQKD